MTFIPQTAGARVPGAHLCPIEWAPDIDIALLTLCDFVADVDGGNLAFDADAIDVVRWSVRLLWFAAGQCAGADLPAVQNALAAARIDLMQVAALMLPFVDEMKPRIEQRIALAAAMMARYC